MKCKNQNVFFYFVLICKNNGKFIEMSFELKMKIKIFIKKL